MIAEALTRLRRRPRRALLAAAGVLAAALMLGTAVSVGVALHGGFDRSARRADLPDVIARFAPRPVAEIRARLAALPNVRSLAFRQEVLGVPLTGHGEATSKGKVEVVLPGRRGYAVVAGRDVGAAAGEVLVEQGVARRLRVGVGDELTVGALGPQRVVGLAVAPDDVAFPLASTARVYVSREGLERRFGERLPARVNVAELWAVDRARLDVTLAQARATTAGVRGLHFTTRDGVRVLVDEAAGIVVALLVALSLVALGVVGVVLAASARAEVQRSLPVLGVRRALGFSRGRAAAVSALEAALLAAPAAALGIGLGAALAGIPTSRLLEALNQVGPGARVLLPLAGAWVAVVALVTVAAGGPAWRAAGRPPVALLRGGDLPGRESSRSAGGFLGLGARLALARPGRLGALVAVLGAATGFVLLLLGLVSLLQALSEDPGTVGKRYDLTAQLEPYDLPAVRAIPGVAAAAQRISVPAADSYDLGETLELVAYRDHSRFEDPPLAGGRRVRAPDEAEVGTGLASALGLSVGGPLAVQIPGGGEARFRVVGLVRALVHDGRIAYVQPRRLVAAGLRGDGVTAVVLAPGADRARVVAALTDLGGRPTAATAATPSAAASPRSAPFLGTIATLLEVVGLVDALVCLFVLVQALGLAARERGRTLAVLRALGAGPGALGLVFAGAAAALVGPALVVGLVLERLVLAPAVARLAAGYAELPLAPPAGQVALVGAGILVLAGAAAGWTARRTGRESIVEGLRGE